VKVRRHQQIRLLFTILVAAGTTLFVSNCTMEYPTDFDSWTFSGFVIDGYTQAALSGATISYLSADGDQKSVTTEANGSFLIESLPYGDRSFLFSREADRDDKAAYTTKVVTAGGFSESSGSEGDLADVSRIVKLFPLQGSLSGRLIARISESDQTRPASSTLVKVLYSDTAMRNTTPSVFETITDSLGAFAFTDLPLAEGLSIQTPGFMIDAIAYAPGDPESPVLFSDRPVTMGTIYLQPVDSTDWPVNLVTSNVLSIDGFGHTRGPVDQTLWYVLSEMPDQASIEAYVDGGGSPDAQVRVSADTVFVDPVKNLSHNELITVTITGQTREGKRIRLLFDGARRFRTAKGLFPVASNTWDGAGEPVNDFDLFDTMGVKYSQALDDDVDKIQWLESDADNSVYGAGNTTNAASWIREDTLFVKPDPRLAVEFGETMGFKVSALSEAGIRSGEEDFVVTLMESDFFITWTNTRDQLGNVRDDFGLMDSVMIVSNVPIEEVTGISGVSNATPPPDMTLDNVVLRGDTIIYRPTLRLKSNTTYGVDFDIRFKDGFRQSGIMPVTWKTMAGIRILSTTNRQDGNFRAFAVYGDSLEVTFSDAVDTRSDAPIRFRVNMSDVNGVPIQTQVGWNEAKTVATIRIIDTLPAADFDASPAYTEDAANTRAVSAVTFDLTTRGGEQLYRFGPESESIEVHTEKGIAAIKSNLLPRHDETRQIDTSEVPDNAFPVDGAVTVTFNRELDVAALEARADSLVAGIRKRYSGQTQVPVSLEYSSDGKTVTIRPDSDLEADTDYYLWLKDLPGKDIAGASAINKNGGSFSGRATGDRLLYRSFRTED
jgi:hypothetical protein